MRRLLPLCLALLSVGAASIMPAHAADSTIRVEGGATAPGLQEAYVDCLFPHKAGPSGTGNIEDANLRGPGTPPLGERTLGYTMITTGGAIGPYSHSPVPQSVTNFSLMVYTPPGQTASGVAGVNYFSPDREVDGDYYAGRAEITAGEGWQLVDAANLAFTWRLVNDIDKPFGIVVPGGASTYQSFIASHGGNPGAGDYSTGFGIFVGCNQVGHHIDAFRLGPAGSVVTVDYEGYLAAMDAYVGQGSNATITAGKSVTVKGYEHNAPVGTLLTLEAKAYDEGDFTVVGTAPEQPSVEPAKLAVSPEVGTTYRWTSPDQDCCEDGMSGEVVVKVRTAVTAKVADSTLRKGKNLVVTGDTTPDKAGVTVTLQRRVGSGWKKLTTATTTASGGYKLVHKVDATGTWNVRVVVPADDANVQGVSPTRSAKVT